jgi:pyruvate dehydrogenase E2 component (dihydrolipoamide acetyltransferase)
MEDERYGMATPVEMPKLGNTVEECLLIRWCKHAGDSVAEGESLAEIETDKATFELTAPVAGTLLGMFFSEGDLVPVFTHVCVLGEPGENIDPFRPQKPAMAFASNSQGEMHQSRQTRRKHAVAAAPSPVLIVSTQGVFSPRAKRFAEEHHFHPKNILGTGPGGRILEDDLKRLYHESPRVSSLAEKMVGAGYELRGEGSGGKGATLSRDLSSPPAKISTIREKIARRMRNSLATTAQYTMHTAADATGLLSLRARIKASNKPTGFPSVSINEMVMFCTEKALEAVPEMNVEFLDGEIYQPSGIHIGFACDTPRGLLVPVVRDSQKLTIIELASKIKSLSKQAIEGGISPEDISGGTFTVSNLGSFGVESFTPILNPPQVAILGVNAIVLKPVRRDGSVMFVEHIGLSITCDHQVIDGAPGAKFLKLVKEKIENIEGISGLGI